MTDRYLFRNIRSIIFRGKSETAELSIEIFKTAISNFDETIQKIAASAEGLFATLGMRNLSAYVGEVFVVSLAKASTGFLIKNPHQDGYPDLLVMTNEGKKLLKLLAENMQDKKPFSDFATGGIEVKSTCGSVPTPAILKHKGLKKPEMGDERISVLTGYDWKAHHQLSNNLIGLVWDFIDQTPTIVGVFFSSNLSKKDWGKIVQPKEGGGRTTSVSIMTRDGIYKMYEGWIAVLNDRRYINFFNRFNESSLIG